MNSFSGISIIICTHNGSERLLPTLEALTHLHADFPWEIVVVDNASSDDTDYMVREFFKTQGEGLNWKIVQEETEGLIYARLTGISTAAFTYVLFCDDDNWLFPDYLTIAADILSQKPKIGVLGGKGIAVFEGEKPDWFDQYSSSFAVGSQSWHLGKSEQKLGYLYGAGAIFKKDLLEEIINSGFELVLTGRKGNTLIAGDDVELCYLAQLKGYELHYSEQLEFYHWMADKRMSWNYYLSLKEGIIKSSALLYSYEYFYTHGKGGVLIFGLSLARELITSVVIYLKNIINPSRDIVHKDLSIRVLESKQLSFKQDYFKAITHFKQLKKYF